MLHRVRRLLALELGLEHDVVDGVAALGREVADGAHAARLRHHVVRDDVVLGHGAVDVTARDSITHAEVERREGPLDVVVERGGLDATRDVDGLRHLRDLLERPLDPIVDATHHTGPKLHGEGLASAGDGVADREARGLLVHLGGSGNGGTVAVWTTGGTLALS